MTATACMARVAVACHSGEGGRFIAHTLRPTLERQRLILAIAKQVQAHLRDQLREGAREPVSEEVRQEHRKLHLVDRK